MNVESNDTCNENANMSSMTPAGQMMKFASEVSKFTLWKIWFHQDSKKLMKRAHSYSWFGFYSSKTTTCLQYDLADMFENGFILSMVTLGKHKVFPLMQHLLPLFSNKSKWTAWRTSNTSIWLLYGKRCAKII